VATRILALDLASNVGWALGGEPGARLMCGTLVLPHIGGEGARFAAFENELADMMTVHRPTHLVVEAPLPLPAQNNAEVARQQLGLRAFAYSEAYRAAVPVHEVDAYTMRKDVLGTGRFPKGKVKEVVFKWARDQGHDVPDHNAADACVLLTYFARRMGGR
jgi:Holliday junction resolvasome RuvABC endonuclease subunit